MSANELGRAASPYLLQHAGNPVHWRMWTPAALQDAQRLNKPIFYPSAMPLATGAT